MNLFFSEGFDPKSHDPIDGLKRRHRRSALADEDKHLEAWTFQPRNHLSVSAPGLSRNL